jgi:hypothetical protein
MAHHVGCTCVTEVKPGLHQPSQHWNGDSLPSSLSHLALPNSSFLAKNEQGEFSFKLFGLSKKDNLGT